MIPVPPTPDAAEAGPDAGAPVAAPDVAAPIALVAEPEPTCGYPLSCELLQASAVIRPSALTPANDPRWDAILANVNVLNWAIVMVCKRERASQAENAFPGRQSSEPSGQIQSTLGTCQLR